MACVQPGSASRYKARNGHEDAMPANTPRDLTEGQRAYEAKRAAKAGMSLDKWLALKERERDEAEKARLKAAAPPPPPKKPGLFARLIERAHKPL
jgi:hypothetical protein